MSGRHPDTTELAEYQAGLTGGLRSRRLAAHVASCARCASVRDQLASVSSALAAAPAPPLPDAVELRITAALAAEAGSATEAHSPTEAHPAADTHGATEAHPAADTHGATDGHRAAGAQRSTEAGPATPSAASVTPKAGSARHASPGRSHAPGGHRHDATGPGRGRRRSLRGGRRFNPAALVGAAAAACLVLIGGAVGLAHLSGSSSSSSAASSAASSAGGGRYALSSGAAQPASGVAPGAQAPARSAPSAAFVIRASGTRYQPGTLAAQVRAEMASTPMNADDHGSSTVSSGTLAACVLHLTGNVRPTLVDRATYRNQPAYVIAVPRHVWVVRPDCTAANPDLITSEGL